MGEILTSLESNDVRQVVSTRIRNLLPSGADWARSAWPITRGSVLGFFLGILPGGGTIVASLVSYGVEKRVSRHPEEFGRGAIEGVAGPEAANNAGAQTSFIPMLTLGLPGNAVMALMIGALTIHGIQPGPQIMTDRPGMFWGLIVSMWIGNLMLLIINLPLIGVWVQLLKVPYRLLYLAILLFCGIGVYTVANSPAAVLLAAFFGVAGYIFMRLECEPAPLVLGFVPLAASAGSHLWRFEQFYSSQDRKVQFIVMREIGGSNIETNISEHWYRTDHYNLDMSDLLGTDLPFGTANKAFLVGTQSYAALAAALLVASYLGLWALTSVGLPLLAAKVATDLTLFAASYAVQRTHVFGRVGAHRQASVELPECAKESTPTTSR